MKLFSILLLAVISLQGLFAQDKYFTKSGHIDFFSHSPLEDIKANNEQVLSIIDTSTGEVAIYVLMKSFSFKKALMQEHFNENYVESDKFPKSVFKGKMTNLDLSKSGDQEVAINGELTLHGKSAPINTTGVFNKSDDKITLKGDFMATVADYGIQIPRTVVNNIGKEIKVTFDLTHEPYQN